MHVFLHATLLVGLSFRASKVLGFWAWYGLPCGEGVLQDAFDLPLKFYAVPMCTVPHDEIFILLGLFFSVAIWTMITLGIQVVIARLRK
jgi:hypothetical protein